MRVRLWGVRGSIPAPGARTAGYGGNTSCVQVSAGDGDELILDAGTGIRELGAAIAGTGSPRCTSCSPIFTSTTSRA